MLFDSFYYFVLLGLTLIVYYLIDENFRWIVILIASLIFIGFLSYSLIPFMILFTLLNYFLGIGIGKLINTNIRKAPATSNHRFPLHR